MIGEPTSQRMVKKGKEINSKRTQSFFAVILFKSSQWMKKLLRISHVGGGAQLRCPEAEFSDEIQTKVLRDFPSYNSQSPLQKLNSKAYNFVEVFGHNLESTQT